MNRKPFISAITIFINAEEFIEGTIEIAIGSTRELFCKINKIVVANLRRFLA